MKITLGQKSHMTQVFTEDGTAIPVTVIETGPLIVTQVKTVEKDGYAGFQVGYGSQKEHRVNKAMKGHLKGVAPFKFLKEFRTEAETEMKVGDTINIDVFAEGDSIEVSSISKGKGFQGVVKRHGFKGGRRSHGQKHSEREPGSIGGGLRSRVPKGMRMAGRMGGDRVTVRNLKIVAIDAESNKILISGAVPGRKGTLVEVKGN